MRPNYSLNRSATFPFFPPLSLSLMDEGEFKHGTGRDPGRPAPHRPPASAAFINARLRGSDRPACARLIRADDVHASRATPSTPDANPPSATSTSTSTLLLSDSLRKQVPHVRAHRMDFRNRRCFVTFFDEHACLLPRRSGYTYTNGCNR
jgi:hypothetical protein